MTDTKTKNDHQYKITLEWITRFQSAVDDLDNQQEEVHPLLLKARRGSMEYRLKNLQEEVDEYERHNPNDPSVLMHKARRSSKVLPKVAG
ncbi:MAG: hypothetical protein OXF24_00880 [Hyphomicrobiales bacterium]|nr:hypothetical protein [Hyphomicrobiales bacterium]